MNPKISVIMSVYNTKEEWLRLAIDSILNQSYKDIEFIIIADCPTDNSVDVIKEYASKDERIVFINNEHNLGLPSSLNKGIAIAKGEYIARMDSDDVALKGRLQEELDYLVNNSLDLVGGRIEEIDENDEPTGFVTNPYNDKTIQAMVMYTNPLAHPTWLAKKEVYEVIGGYREIKNCEDYDFLLRLSKTNYRIGQCDKVVLKYRVNKKGITQSNRLNQFLTKKCLLDNYDCLEMVNQEMINNQLANITEKEDERFSKGSKSISDGFLQIKQRNILGIVSVIKGIFSSKYCMSNFITILKMRRAIKTL